MVKFRRESLDSRTGALFCAALLLCSFSSGPAALSKQTKEGKEISAQVKETPATTSAETAMPVYEAGKKLPRGMAESSVDITIASNPAGVCNALVKFEDYPRIFKRIKTSEITKREGDLIFVETYLKPQMFVKNNVQHTVTNIADSPHRINWKQLDGNFKHVDGSWNLTAVDGGKTKLTYTLHVDAGTLVPPSMVAFFLKFVQNEIVKQLKQYVEQQENARKTISQR